MARNQTQELQALSRSLAKAMSALPLAKLPGITHVYNPLVYARALHEQYLSRFGEGKERVLLLGMNPGPWGMAQTGVPFGEVKAVRDWMKLSAKVDKPEPEHPKRPVLGLSCTRSEVSGARLWGWAEGRFGTARVFFQEFFVWNYCPLSFMAASGANVTPDKLPKNVRTALEDECDRALGNLVKILEPRALMGIGGFAQKKLQRISAGEPVHLMAHPSPASPQANRGWAALADAAVASIDSR